MTNAIHHLNQLSDDDLLVQVQHAAKDERQATVRLVALLMELDTRRLYLGQGFASLFAYCTQVLHLSEHAAYLRIEAARAARRFPLILQRLADGEIHLTAIGLLASHLTEANCVDVLDAARHRSKRDLEELVARLRPQPDVPAGIRRLPEPKAVPIRQEPDMIAVDQPSPPRPAANILIPKPASEVKPLTPERYKIQFTVDRETYDKLRRAQDLLRHTIPTGDPAAIFDKALTLLLAELSRTKLAAAERPRAARTGAGASRHIPAAVKREVWTRDGGRCAFKGTQGRCRETGFLEFHHIVPFAAGGQSTVENIEIRCRRHNAYEAEQYFGLSSSLFAREAQASPVDPATRSGPSQ